MDDKKKKRSPKPCLAQPAQAPSTLRRVPVPTSHSGSLALGLPHLPSPKQRAKFKRVGKEKCRPVLAGGGGGSAGTPLQHSFLTEVTDVYEMEGGLLNLLNDFHSGKLQAFGRRRMRKMMTESLRGYQKNRRRRWLTATWTSCLATLKILVILYRNFTWPRTLSLRSSQLHRCWTQAQTASHFFQSDFLWTREGIPQPPRCYGGGGTGWK
ncbi:coiled-coil domain-containing protein 28B isoform X1 [Cavia porcellus]|uniref:coiled-coil domain-containing protein 28B isoform X1 n=1 Tax=Cavia porcellus TaxID=10141 RepID=UPI002FE21146